jgi:hypothetical protein
LNATRRVRLGTNCAKGRVCGREVRSREPDAICGVECFEAELQIGTAFAEQKIFQQRGVQVFGSVTPEIIERRVKRADVGRYQTHVVVEFEEPVQGPVLVCRGRFRGYGLFRPIWMKEEASDE